MWRSFASLGLVKHEAPHFSTARPTYETGSAKSVIDGNGEKRCLRVWKERLPSLRAARAALALQSRARHQHPRRIRRDAGGAEAHEERRSQIRITEKEITEALPDHRCASARCAEQPIAHVD